MKQINIRKNETHELKLCDNIIIINTRVPYPTYRKQESEAHKAVRIPDG